MLGKLVRFAGCALLVLGALVVGGRARAATSGITSPKSGAVVYGIVIVKGLADAPDFAEWRLDLLSNGDPTAANQIARSQKRFTKEDTLAKWDTSELPDGQYALRLRVLRTNGQYDESIVSVQLNNTNPPSPPPAPARAPAAAKVIPSVNRVLAPANNAVIKGVVTIQGVADEPTFQSWKLDLILDGKADRTVTIAAGRTPVPTAAVLTLLDTTLLANGNHLLRLRVAKADNSFTESRISITIANAKAVQPASPVRCTGIAVTLAPLPLRLLATWFNSLTTLYKTYCGV